MKNLKLNHQSTPTSLIPINAELESVLSSEDLDDKRLLELIILRDELISAHLDSIDETTKKKFVKAEYDVNTVLSKIAQRLFKASLSNLSGLVRGKKAVEKYK